MNFKIVIPARFYSSRFPGKPLAELAGKPMIWHTYQRALETGLDKNNIVIATEHEEIKRVVEDFDGQCVMTSVDHNSGTSRLAEVAEYLGWSNETIVVNLQGDEPCIKPELVNNVAQILAQDDSAGIATLASVINNKSDLLNSNIVKVICNIHQHAIYFSRAPIPFVRDGLDSTMLTSTKSPWLRHIGMYAYRVGTLKAYVQWPETILEELEKLEQLKAIYNDINIAVGVINKAPAHGVDTPEDLIKIQQQIEKLNL